MLGELQIPDFENFYALRVEYTVAAVALPTVLVLQFAANSAQQGRRPRAIKLQAEPGFLFEQSLVDLRHQHVVKLKIKKEKNE